MKRNEIIERSVCIFIMLISAGFVFYEMAIKLQIIEGAYIGDFGLSIAVIFSVILWLALCIYLVRKYGIRGANNISDFDTKILQFLDFISVDNKENQKILTKIVYISLYSFLFGLVLLLCGWGITWLIHLNSVVLWIPGILFMTIGGVPAYIAYNLLSHATK